MPSDLTLRKRILRSLVMDRNPQSWSARQRVKRMNLLRSLLVEFPRPLSILDVGGTQTAWKRIGFADDPSVQVTLLNLHCVPVDHSNIRCVLGDARSMAQFADGAFDLVFSNSVIEHVGDKAAARQMAQEIRRVGRSYFVQTPNRYFPIEPHFLFPFFQFLPISTRVRLHVSLPLGWYAAQPNRQQAEEEVRSIRLLDQQELEELFPDGTLVRERLCGLTKSFMMHRVCAGERPRLPTSVEDNTLAELRLRSSRGLNTLFIRNVVVIALNLIASIVLTRISGPKLWGGFAVALFLYMTAQEILGRGFASQLIRMKQEPTVSEIKTVFALQNLAGVLFFLSTLFFGGIAEVIYHVENMRWFLYATGIACWATAPILWIALPVAVVVGATPLVVPLLFGYQWNGVAFILLLCEPAYLLAGVFWPVMSGALLARSKHRCLILVQIILTGIYATGTLAWAIRYGSAAGAFAYSLAHILSYLLLFFSFQREVGVVPLLRPIMTLGLCYSVSWVLFRAAIAGHYLMWAIASGIALLLWASWNWKRVSSRLFNVHGIRGLKSQIVASSAC